MQFKCINKQFLQIKSTLPQDFIQGKCITSIQILMKLFNVLLKFYRDKMSAISLKYFQSEDRCIRIWETISLQQKTSISQLILILHLLHIILEEFLSSNQKIISMLKMILDKLWSFLKVKRILEFKMGLGNVFMQLGTTIKQFSIMTKLLRKIKTVRIKT